MIPDHCSSDLLRYKMFISWIANQIDLKILEILQLQLKNRLFVHLSLLCKSLVVLGKY